MREAIISNKELSLRLEALENKYDEQFSVVFTAIKELIDAPSPRQNTVGFPIPKS